jgi:hypothetical protein
MEAWEKSHFVSLEELCMLVFNHFVNLDFIFSIKIKRIIIFSHDLRGH